MQYTVKHQTSHRTCIWAIHGGSALWIGSNALLTALHDVKEASVNVAVELDVRKTAPPESPLHDVKEAPVNVAVELVR